MIVGLCQVVSIPDLDIITYVFETYELALAQALELQKGVAGEGRSLVPEPKPGHALRAITFVFPDTFDIVMVQEVEVGRKVLEVKLS